MKKFNYPKLLNAETKDAFSLELKSRFSELKVEEEVDTMWKEVKEVLIEISQEVLGYMDNKRQNWMSDCSWLLTGERKILKQHIIQ
jgi:hypothetical protein